MIVWYRLEPGKARGHRSVRILRIRKVGKDYAANLKGSLTLKPNPYEGIGLTYSAMLGYASMWPWFRKQVQLQHKDLIIE